jgi:hypothetical protein
MVTKNAFDSARKSLRSPLFEMRQAVFLVL